jgi:hypothetical protein
MTRLGLLAGLAALTLAASTQAQDQLGAGRPAQATGPIKTERYHASYVRLGDRMDGLLYEPAALTHPNIALVFTFPRATFGALPASEMASRGYRILLVTPITEDQSPMDGVPDTSKGIAYMRTLPGVERVVVMSHSGGGRMMAFYTDVALNGPKACQDPRLVYPCKTQEASGLAKPDGLVLLDSAPGAFNTASAVDPAVVDGKRTRADLDMYAPVNGYDPKTGAAHYSADFLKRFYAAQSARNAELVDRAVARLKLIEQGKGEFKDDEPLVIPGAVDGGDGASPYLLDMSLQAHTKRPHTLLKADGASPEVIVPSVRAPTGLQDASRNVGTLCCASLNYTVKRFLSNDALRTTKDFAVTADDIVGVDWRSSLRSTPGSAEGITVPTLVLAMSCFHFVVADEIIYDHLAAKDKTYAVVEGALHEFNPCKPEYGDTTKRTFDFVDGWLSKPGRF